jgi:hypothetical protein
MNLVISYGRDFRVYDIRGPIYNTLRPAICRPKCKGYRLLEDSEARDLVRDLERGAEARPGIFKIWPQFPREKRAGAGKGAGIDSDSFPMGQR